MTKKFVLMVELKEKEEETGNGVLSVSWDKEGMTYPEMLGYLEMAKDHIKEKEGRKT
ncbi:MAG: hypothetical protein GF334_05875 [Candidatus Altiarchaeales archaeon]|nr:hypothetical protein [Candidatus Altiarchaeales archaeon]